MDQDSTQHLLPLQPPSPSRLKLILGDITTLEVDALVVPCKGSLLEGGRVSLGLHHMWPGNSLKVRTRVAVPVGTLAGLQLFGS